jgi:hypothetical protein
MAIKDSAPVVGTLLLEGVWLHDPDDPSNTATNYRYGRAARSTALDVEANALQFAGRVYPVYDYGEQQTENYSVRIELTDDEGGPAKLRSLEAFAVLRKTLMLRDNRGRRAYGNLEGYREDDQDYGTAVDFSFVRVDYDEGTTVVL